MTEEEAKTKWCPHVARDPRDGDSIATGQCCIGSECMAWRWDEAWIADERTPDKAVALRSDTHGYCGLAGRP